MSPHFLDLVQDALLASFWRLESLKKFLRRSGISENALSQLNGTTTKRIFLDWLFPQIEKSPKGEALINKISRELASQTSFPDLQGWPDTDDKIARARLAVASLKHFIDNNQAKTNNDLERQRIRELAESHRIRRQTHEDRLIKLKERLEAELMPLLGSQSGGYQFQDWFADLCQLFEIAYKKPYRDRTREVDGSVTIEGTTYLLSLKFTKEPVGSPAMDDIRVRVGAVADNTMGLVISMSGFIPAAVADISIAGTKIILLDYAHVYAVLMGTMNLQEMVKRVREHASRTGDSFLAFSDFSRS
jgi:hypothetical protein